LYAATKKSNELMAHAYSHLFGLPTTGLRFFTVYGPWGRPDMALFIFAKAIVEDKPIKLFNNGNMVRDFTYIDDIVEGVARTLDTIAKPCDEQNVGPSESATAPYRVYNIGNGTPVSLETCITLLEKYLGKRARKELYPMQLGDVPVTAANVIDLVKDIKYRPATKVEEGIKKFVTWYVDDYCCGPCPS
ncbi:MAG TPA: NAD-dependent epimerase/dehydratase family protein, partial [Mesotoga sp.]|nr:NAD-dependent epimerase/dehydratase family protein [Mesotoga sp.]